MSRAGEDESALNVVFINHNSAEHLGGAELSLLAIVDRWMQRVPELRPIVVSPGAAPAMTAAVAQRGWRHVHLDFEGWAVYSVDGGRAQARLRDRAAARATRAIGELLVETDAALVVTNTLLHPWGALAAAAAGVPHVWFVREFGHRDQGFIFPRGRETALREIGELSARVVANSHAVRDELLPHIAAELLVVSYPPVDIDEVRRRAEEPADAPTPTAQPLADPATRDPHPAPPGRDAALSLCVLGRVTHSKGQWRVIEALGTLASAGVRVRAVFVGQILDRDADVLLARRARELGVGELVDFVGERSNPFPYVRLVDVGVVPSQREPFGRTTLECLALGRPVITTRDGAGAELVVPGESGELVAADSIGELAEAIRGYVDDPGRARRQAPSAMARAESLMSGASSIDAAITALGAAIGAEPARLPQDWAEWMRRLDLTATAGHPRWWRLQARAGRVLRFTARALRHPRRSLDRLRGIAGARRRR